jgi:threonyl-tRNA synthetase
LSAVARCAKADWQATRRLHAEAREASNDGPPDNFHQMPEISVTLPDGSSRRVPVGTTPADVAGEISPRLAKAALAAIVDDRLVDLSHPLQTDARVRIVTPESPEALPLYRHSTAHLMAAAVTHLFPGAQCGIGPATDDGFFYDFIVERPFVPEDLDAIEKKMKELAAADLPYERQMWPRDEARAFFATRGEPLKVQLIEEKAEGQREVSCYTIKDRDTFVDFCVGPHVPSSGRLKGFKLLSTSNAYWKGDARNQPMQRVYGTAFFSEKELQAYLQRIEEAKKRDHRKLGKELGLFTFHPWAPGATFWLDRGTTLYNTLAGYMREVLFPAGYVELKTPLVYNKGLWDTSGHWDHYRENMFLVEGRDGEEMAMKAMNCPGHMLVFASEMRSYKDLPLRFHEQTPLHRNEFSGVLAGLTRVRQFSQDDAHCFVTPDQIAAEVEALLRLVQRVYGDFGLEYEAKLSTRPAEFLGKVETWDHAEVALKQALQSAGQAYTLNEGDGAFYGPKIDFDITDAIGRKWQCATIQLDYQMPQRFGLKYIGADNTEHCPVVIHRAIFGSFERFIALLIEHYAGAFPLWLAPLQAVVLPISDRHLENARGVQARLAAAGLRVEVDERQEKIGYKIREAQLQKIPYMLVVGDREAADGAVSVRSRTAGDLGARAVGEFAEAALAEVQARSAPGMAQGSSHAAMTAAG